MIFAEARGWPVKPGHDGIGLDASLVMARKGWISYRSNNKMRDTLNDAQTQLVYAVIGAVEVPWEGAVMKATAVSTTRHSSASGMTSRPMPPNAAEADLHADSL
jgi:hypothetical protein